MAHRLLRVVRHPRSWTIPSNIPVSGFGGKSLFGLFTESIGQQLAHFPQGPALTDDFWRVPAGPKRGARRERGDERPSRLLRTSTPGVPPCKCST